jgi:serine/threonine protein phosphatase PrpC
MRIKAGMSTDKGRKRSHNEDALYADQSMGLFVIADGMGGHKAGEVASRIAIENIVKDLGKSLSAHECPVLGEYRDDFSAESNKLASSVRLANQEIFKASQEKSECNGMGATVVAICLSGNIMSVAYVGDSRLYLIRNNEIDQLTDDHSLVYEQLKKGVISEKEAKESQYRNIITRALGVENTVEVELDEQVVLVNDCILMCSDGLYDMVDDDEILNTVLKNSKKPQKACDSLVELANDNGGSDNISVILLRL